MAIRIPKNYLIAAAPLLSKNKSGRSAKFNESEFFWGTVLGAWDWSGVWCGVGGGGGAFLESSHENTRVAWAKIHVFGHWNTSNSPFPIRP